MLEDRSKESKWLEWVSRLAAIAQNGLAHAESPFDVERYASVRELAAEIAAEHTDSTPQRISGIFERESGYATPKIDVRGAVFRDDALLMVQERDDELWALPGGWADPGESPSAAVAREVYEESGFRVQGCAADRRLRSKPP